MFTEKLPDSARGTSELMDFVDKLFDSVNGVCVYGQAGKDLRVAISDKSPHLEFWDNAIPILSTIKPIDTSGRVTTQPPSVRNWIWTLKGFKQVWALLKSEGFQFLSTRNFNQDPLENFFGCIRSQGVRNVNPTCKAFIDSFKTLIINNFLNPHSPSGNCEDDEDDGVLNSLKDFIFNTDTTVTATEVSDMEDSLEMPVFYVSNDIIDRNMGTYMAGFIAKRVLRLSKCNLCRQTLVKQGTNTFDEILLTRRAYTPKTLCVPGTLFSKIFSEIYFYCEKLMPQLCNREQIKCLMVNLIKKVVVPKYNSVFCSTHSLLLPTIECTVTFYILSWIRSVNKILHGHSNMICPQLDDVKKTAFYKYSRNLRKRKPVQ